MISGDAFARGEHQDWETVVFKKRPQKFGNTEKDINTARRENRAIDVINKNVIKATDNASINKRKLDQETEDFHHKLVPNDIAKSIEKARIENKLTQEALAHALNMQVKDINEIEKGKAIYNGQVLAKIKKYLHLK